VWIRPHNFKSAKGVNDFGFLNAQKNVAFVAIAK
jgi:hypothetical protein